MSNEDLPSIKWKQPRKADYSPKYPIQNNIAIPITMIWIVIRVAIHFQINKEFNLQGLLIEMVLDPVLWGLVIWSGMVSDRHKNEEGVSVGAFDCPHCGKARRAHKNTLAAPLGYVGRCSDCNNRYVKRSAPPRL